VPARSRPVLLIVGPLLQAVLNLLYLRRLMINPHAFAPNRDFHTQRSRRERHLNSSTALFLGPDHGVVTTPVAERSVRGGPGHRDRRGNLLLSRSSDVTGFQ
jgi:hypothetical protein